MKKLQLESRLICINTNEFYNCPLPYELNTMFGTGLGFVTLPAACFPLCSCNTKLPDVYFASKKRVVVACDCE